MSPHSQARPANSGWAIFIMVGAAALVAVTSLIAKALGVGGGASGLHPLQVSMGRFWFALAALGLFVALRPSLRPAFDVSRWRLHLARSICGWIGVTAMFAAVAQMPMAEATAISFLNPVVTVVLAALMLSERLGVRKLAAMGLALAGAALILRPGGAAFQIAGVYALIAALILGLETIFIKRLTNAEPPLRILLFNNAIGAVLSGVAAFFVWTAPTAEQWLLLICLGGVMICAQGLFLQAMKRGEASYVIPAFYSVLVFAALYDWGLYGVIPDAFAFAGSALIMTGVILLSRVKA